MDEPALAPPSTPAARATRLILTLHCPDRIGIVAAVARAIADHGGNIAQSAQFGDEATGAFFMRIAFDAPGSTAEADFSAAFSPIAASFGMRWRVMAAAERPAVLILVSRLDHCLADLIYRWQINALPMRIAGIVSNHESARLHAERNGLVFHHLPVEDRNRAAQERRIMDIVAQTRADLVVLARYMQVLSDDAAMALAGRCINIHHSFLPSFKGANPYRQAHRRGVKLIGATAHYITGDLDEGPIIEQETERVDHAMSVEALTAIGREIEARVLARAVKFHLEGRVFLNGDKTVVFR